MHLLETLSKLCSVLTIDSIIGSELESPHLERNMCVSPKLTKKWWSSLLEKQRKTIQIFVAEFSNYIAMLISTKMLVV